MAQFINDKEKLVTDAIDGIINVSGGHLARLDGYPHIKVVVRADWEKTKVALVSGGGSGHEPSHAGFVGKGMLTAAVCGDIFASPSVDAVLAGILAVTGPAGCLLIVKNYTGDRLNFGLAAERARTFGLKVSMVIVDDDIALPDLHQPRGLAGTLLVHKIAGAVADNGDTLDQVTKAANRVIAGVKSIGMSLSTCTIPGSPKEDRIPDGKAELGLGIHGEAGVEQVEFSTAKNAISQVVDKLNSHMSSKPHVVLLNNLGGVTEIEMSVLAKELFQSKIASPLRFVIGPASMMTSLDMHGFSITIYPLQDSDEILLKQNCEPAAWKGCFEVINNDVVALPDGLTPILPIPSEHPETAAFLTQCCEVFIASEGDLNALDAKSGDGDTGTTLSRASRALIDSLDRLPLADNTQLFRAIGSELNQTMGGSSGVLLAIFFTAVGDAASSGLSIVAAMQAGLERMSQVGGAKVGDRTMIDALQPALNELEGGIAAAAKAARKGADHTANITAAKAGRATYLSKEQLQGHNDPGAEAVARLFEQLAKIS